MVERNRGDVVMKDVRFDDAVEEVSADEAKLAVDCRCCAAREVPGVALVVWEGGVCVLQEGNRNCS